MKLDIPKEILAESFLSILYRLKITTYEILLLFYCMPAGKSSRKFVLFMISEYNLKTVYNKSFQGFRGGGGGGLKAIGSPMSLP